MTEYAANGEPIITPNQQDTGMRMLRLGRRWKWRCDLCSDVSDWYPGKGWMETGAFEHRLTPMHKVLRQRARKEEF